MLSPGFTRENIRRAEPRIAKHVNHFMEKLGCYAQSGEPADLSKGFLCLANDGVMEQIFQKPFGALDAEDFDSEFIVPVHEYASIMQWPQYFPNLFKAIYKLIEMLPNWALERWLRGFATQKKCLEVGASLSAACFSLLQTRWWNKVSIETLPQTIGFFHLLSTAR